MIADRLKQLGIYAEELEKEEPLDLLNIYFNQIISKLENLPRYQSSLGEDFENDVVKVVNDYVSKELISPMISYQLLCILVNFIKSSMIESIANSLDIDKNLYKREMKFLFKGKWK